MHYCLRYVIPFSYHIQLYTFVLDYRNILNLSLFGIASNVSNTNGRRLCFHSMEFKIFARALYFFSFVLCFLLCFLFALFFIYFFSLYYFLFFLFFFSLFPLFPLLFLFQNQFILMQSIMLVRHAKIIVVK